MNRQALLAPLAPLALIAALAPSPSRGDVPPTEVKVTRSSPYRSSAEESRWLPQPMRTPMAPRLARVPSAVREADAQRAAAAAAEQDEITLARARACKVFDRNASGAAEGGDPMVEGWRFRLESARARAKVRETGWDGCAEFRGLHPGSYSLSEVPPPFWESSVRPAREFEVDGVAAVPPALFSGACIQHARMGKTEYWTGLSGLRLLEERDRRALNSLPPFRSPSGTFARGAEPFDGRFSDGVTPVQGTAAGRGAFGPGSWQAEVANYLTDRKVAADPRGRLAQEILVFVLNSEHFLERAKVVYVEEMPVLVDDLIFEGILAWYGDNPAWNHEMTALLASLNGTQGLPYVPREQCQVAYLPF